MPKEPEKPLAVAMDPYGRELYPYFRQMVCEDLTERVENLANGRETIPVVEVLALLKGLCGSVPNPDETPTL